MAGNGPRYGLLTRALAAAVAVIFAFSSVPAYAMRPNSLGSSQRDGGEGDLEDLIETLSIADANGDKTIPIIPEIESTVNTLVNGEDGGAVEAIIEIFSENVVIGDEAKGSQVGRVISVAKAVEERLTGAILGHSATRKAQIKNDTKVGVEAQMHERTLTLNSDGFFFVPQPSEEEAYKIAHDNAFTKFDRTMNKRIHAQKKAGVKKLSLCVGSDRDNLPIDEEIADVLKQLDVSLEGITISDLENLMWYIAWEPAGSIGTGVAEGPDKIRIVHQAMYDWFVKKYQDQAAVDRVWGKTLKILYGASVDGKNVDGIMAVKSQKPGMEGTQLVHGVLFASSGVTIEGFLAVAEGVSRAAVRDDAQYISFINLKGFPRAKKTPVKQYIVGIYKSAMAGKLDTKRTILAIADQDVHLKEWQDAVNTAAINPRLLMTGMPVPKLKSLSTLYSIIKAKALKTGFIVCDMNENPLEAFKKQAKVVSLLVKMAKESPEVQDYYLVTHYKRPEGKGFEAKLSLAEHQKKLQELIDAEGLNAVVILLPYDLAEAAKVRAEAQMKYADKIRYFLPENVRFYSGEKSKVAAEREAFAGQLIALTGKSAEELFVVNEADEKAHRDETSVRELVNKIAKANGAVAAGPAFQKNFPAAIQFVNEVTGQILYVEGGAKFDKLELSGETLASDQTKKIFYVGALSNPVSQELGKSIGKSLMPGEKEQKAVDKGLKSIKATPDWQNKIAVPVDYKVEQITEEKGVPKQVAVKEATAEIAADQTQFDIGPKTIELLTQEINALQPGDGVVLNGGAGVFEKDEYWQGTDAMIMAAVLAGVRGVKVMALGGDMTKAVDKFKKFHPDLAPIVDAIFFQSLGGGSVLTVMARGPEKMSAVNPLLEDAKAAADGGDWYRFQQTMFNEGTRLGIQQSILSEGIGSDWAMFLHNGGEEYVQFLAKLKDALKNKPLQEGVAIVVSPEVFRLGGMFFNMNWLSELTQHNVRIAMYAPEDSAQRMKQLVGINDIVTDNSFEGTVAQLNAMGVKSENIILLKTSKDKVKAVKEVRQYVVDKVATVAVAKALKDLTGKDALFKDYLDRLYQTQTVKIPASSREELMAQVIGGIEELPADITSSAPEETIEKELVAIRQLVNQV